MLLPSCFSRSKERILISQKFSRVRLPEDHDSCWIQPSALICAPRCHAKTQGCIVHAVHNHTLVLWTILRPAADVRLDDVATIQERHFAVGFDPDLVAGMLREDGERGDVEAEFTRLSEFA